jgi:hypothetical protein
MEGDRRVADYVDLHVIEMAMFASTGVLMQDIRELGVRPRTSLGSQAMARDQPTARE